MHLSNSIYSHQNRTKFGGPIQERFAEKTKKIDFTFALSSFRYPEEFFTNFSKSDNFGRFQKLKGIYLENEEGKDILKKFRRRYVENIDKHYFDRIIRILNYHNRFNITEEQVVNMLKCKYREDPRIQLFIMSDNGVSKVYLVDLHHLGFPGDADGRRYDMNDMYRKFENAEYNISHILD